MLGEFEDCEPSPVNFDRWHTEARGRFRLFPPRNLPGLALLAWRVHTPSFWPDLLSENKLIEQSALTRALLTTDSQRLILGLDQLIKLNLLLKEVSSHANYELDYIYDSNLTKTYHCCDKGVHCALFQAQHKTLDRLVELAEPLIDSALRRLPRDLTKIINEYYRPLHLRCIYTCPYLPEEDNVLPSECITDLDEYTTVHSYMDLGGADPNFYIKYRALYAQRVERLLRNAALLSRMNE